MTWSEEHATKIEETEHPYPDPFCAEGPWRQLPSGKVYLFKRVDHRFAAPVFGDELSQLEGYTDQYDRMVLYETTDEGRTIRSLRTLGGLSQMYPAMLRLADGRLLFTFAVRSIRRSLGVRAVLGREVGDHVQIDVDHDRFLLDTQTAPDVLSGGGLGLTVQLDDGTLVTSYSWRDAHDETHVEGIRWRSPER